MATPAELQAQIDACSQTITRCHTQMDHERREIELATERQRLRRVLEEKQKEVRFNNAVLCNLQADKRLIDKDVYGAHRPEQPIGRNEARPSEHRSCVAQRDMLDAASSILKGELEWSLKGFSWLIDALRDEGNECATSHSLAVGDHRFRLCYHPGRGEMGSHSQRASLAIMHENLETDGVAFRYKLQVKSRSRGYVQWGGDGHACIFDDADDCLFGPDVCKEDGGAPSGIFGCTHEQLLQSEWVVDDVLTVMLTVTLREMSSLEETTEEPSDLVVAVPPSSLINDLLFLLDSGSNSDVTFTVQGEAINAHSSVLCARSVVLRTQLTCGMQESTSKRVAIEDCKPLVFKAFLRYLYTDDFRAMETCLQEKATNEASGSVERPLQEGFMPSVQQMLVLAHKYQITRLQNWCQNKLAEGISIGNVCAILCQAHLYSASCLEKKCLELIKQNMNQVVATENFTSLQEKWPQVSLKIISHLANISQEKTAEALEVQQKRGKRKRDD